MLHSPNPPRSSPPVPGSLLGSQPFLPLHTLVTQVPSLEESDADAILGTLRGAVNTGASELGPILTAIAEAAQTLTGASGAALALRRDGVVVCCARSGDAPEIGARLSEDSGISGECLRTGKALRCDDTQKDYRVNPEACRKMNLRSIAIMPLRGRQGTIGILEVFSTRAYAFSEDLTRLLERLAELAEAAQLAAPAPREPRTQFKRETAAPALPAPIHSTAPSEESTQALARLAGQWQAEERDTSRYVRMGVAAALLAVVALIGWRTLAKPRNTVATEIQVTPPAILPVENPASTPSAGVVVKPDDDLRARLSNSISTDVASRSEAGTETLDQVEIIPDVVRRVANRPSRTSSTPASSQASSADRENLPVAASSTSPVVEEPRVEAPKAVAPSADSASLGSLVAPPASLPKLAQVSQGVTQGVVEHKVNPTYPSQALAMGIAGSVILDATIGEDGKVRELKVLDGHPVLARAAVDAVRQWRYRPYMLNGKPITMQEQITVSFKP